MKNLVRKQIGPAEVFYDEFFDCIRSAHNILLSDGRRVNVDVRPRWVIEELQAPWKEKTIFARFLDGDVYTWVKVRVDKDDVRGEICASPGHEEDKLDTRVDDFDTDCFAHDALLDILADNIKAEEFYASLCNVDWHHSNGEVSSFSWRGAGSFVAMLRNKGEDYLDFYCSGNEGYVAPWIKDIMAEIGWRPEPMEDF